MNRKANRTFQTARSHFKVILHIKFKIKAYISLFCVQRERLNQVLCQPDRKYRHHIHIGIWFMLNQTKYCVVAHSQCTHLQIVDKQESICVVYVVVYG